MWQLSTLMPSKQAPSSVCYCWFYPGATSAGGTPHIRLFGEGIYFPFQCVHFCLLRHISKYIDTTALCWDGLFCLHLTSLTRLAVGAQCPEEQQCCILWLAQQLPGSSQGKGILVCAVLAIWRSPVWVCLTWPEAKDPALAATTGSTPGPDPHFLCPVLLPPCHPRLQNHLLLAGIGPVLTLLTCAMPWTWFRAFWIGSKDAINIEGCIGTCLSPQGTCSSSEAVEALLQPSHGDHIILAVAHQRFLWQLPRWRCSHQS